MVGQVDLAMIITMAIQEGEMEGAMVIPEMMSTGTMGMQDVVGVGHLPERKVRYDLVARPKVRSRAAYPELSGLLLCTSSNSLTRRL